MLSLICLSSHEHVQEALAAALAAESDAAFDYGHPQHAHVREATRAGGDVHA